MATYKLLIADNKRDLAVKASEVIASNIALSFSNKNSSQIAFCGGSTPIETYKLLGQKNLDWKNVDIFLGDERWVDINDQSNNGLMIKNTFLSQPYGSASKFHPVPFSGCINPQESADKYEELIKRICLGNPPSFDLILLGLGDDGHTASLFPATSILDIKDRYVAITSGKGLQRITLTPPVINAAQNIIFLVSGKSKQTALKRLLDENEDYKRTPAKIVNPSSEVLIIADRPAVELI